jgi:hypothetical protein
MMTKCKVQLVTHTQLSRASVTKAQSSIALAPDRRIKRTILMKSMMNWNLTNPVMNWNLTNPVLNRRMMKDSQVHQGPMF